MAESADRPVLSLKFTFQVRHRIGRLAITVILPGSDSDIQTLRACLQIGERRALNVVDATDAVRLIGP
jgi:hypothetical protein